MLFERVYEGDRTHVYGWFERYRQYCQNNSLFDACDLVHNLYSRSLQLNADPSRRFAQYIIHQIYVDETQDFTQAELALLTSTCAWANRMFFTGTNLLIQLLLESFSLLTEFLKTFVYNKTTNSHTPFSSLGDTAQCIMYGISFRFADLKSLFYGVQCDCETQLLELARMRRKKLLPAQVRRLVESRVRIPSRIYQLVHNYRSHNGVLRLASALIDILISYFPESIDRLKRDQGIYVCIIPI